MRNIANLCLLLLTLFAAPSRAQDERVIVAFYNLENLYDTIPSLFHNDADYLPGGRNKWNAERYRRKLANLARVIDELDADILGVCEVESEAALRDLVMTLSTDYNYIHHSSNDRRGMDLGLLYKGDKFIPEAERLVGSGYGREFLYVRGELCGHRVDIIACHLPSNLNSRAHKRAAIEALYDFANMLHRTDPDARPIVMGDFNTVPSDQIMKRYFCADCRSGSPAVSDVAKDSVVASPGVDTDLNDSVATSPATDTNILEPDRGNFFLAPFTSLAAKGYGTYAYNGRWSMLDNIFVSGRLESGPMAYAGCGVFIRRYMLDGSSSDRRGYPLRTFSSSRYTGGFSDHLPVYVTLVIESAED